MGLTFRPEVNLPKGFTTSIDSRPAFDDFEGKYGVSDVNLFFNLIGPRGALSWELSTGWYLPITAFRGHVYSDSVRRRYDGEYELQHPDGQVVVWHRYAKSGRNCSLSPTGKCWSDVGYLVAETGTPILLVNGIEGVWNWLLELHQETDWKTTGRWSRAS